LQKTFAEAVDSVLSIHRRRIDGLIDSVRQTAAEIFDVPFRQHVDSDSFGLGEEPYWVTGNIETGLIPDPSGLIDRFRTKGSYARRLRSRLVAQANELIVRNAENLRWAVLRGVDETFRRAGRTLDGRIDDAVAATRGVIDEALARRRDQLVAVDSDLNRLNFAKNLLGKLQEELAEQADEFVESGPPLAAGARCGPAHSIEPEPGRC
jgi:hypothetical protein